jgi:hypothetical protein
LLKKIHEKQITIQGLNEEIERLEKRLTLYEDEKGNKKPLQEKFQEEYPSFIEENWNSISVCQDSGPKVVVRDKQTIENFKALLTNVKELSLEETKYVIIKSSFLNAGICNSTIFFKSSSRSGKGL